MIKTGKRREETEMRKRGASFDERVLMICRTPRVNRLNLIKRLRLRRRKSRRFQLGGGGGGVKKKKTYLPALRDGKKKNRCSGHEGGSINAAGGGSVQTSFG